MRPASEVWEDAYRAWDDTPPNPNDIASGDRSAAAIIEADRKQVREEVVREVCEWLRGEYWSKADWNVAHASDFASAIERKFLGEKA